MTATIKPQVVAPAEGAPASDRHVHGPDCRHSHGHVAPPFARAEAKVGRNDPCPCGSGRKFKKCCLKDE